MRWVPIAVLVLSFAGLAWAQDEARRAQVTAATENAVQALYEEVARRTVARNVTVEQLLEQTGGREHLMKILQTAEQVGGPRWIDEQTCQVQLEIAGPRVARALGQIAALNPRKTPVAAEVLLHRLREWDDLSFTATGTSTGAARAARLRPLPADEAWSTVSDAGRRHAVNEARDHAVQRVIESLRSVDLDEQRQLGELFDASPAIPDALGHWLVSRPVTSIDFREDLQVEMSISAPPQEVFEALRSILERDRRLVQGLQWDHVRRQVEELLVEPVGVGKVPANGRQEARPPLQLPRQAPPWVQQQLQAEATSDYAGNRLKTARAAEAKAVAQLQAEVEKLPLANGTTIGEAAEQNPLLRESLDRALNRARLAKTDYNYTGREDVLVRVQLDLRDVWEEFQAQR